MHEKPRTLQGHSIIIKSYYQSIVDACVANQIASLPIVSHVAVDGVSSKI